MGGHGGLNILPQKRWNVYNFDNREKVRQDEEAAAKEEQIKREQSRRRDSELRLEKLREARGIPSRVSTQPDVDPSSVSAPAPIESPEVPLESESDSKHFNLFEGIRIFDIAKESERKESKRKGKYAEDRNKNKKVKKEEVRVVGPEDEKYRMGYGIAGKGVKLPWYMEKKVANQSNDEEEGGEEHYAMSKKSGEKKSLEELRAERLNREMLERERVRALLATKSRKAGGFSSTRR